MCQRATTPAGPELAWITAVALEVAVDEPTEFVAVTATRRVLPTSAPVSVYAGSVAPGIAAQAPPAPSQRCHWYA